MSKVVAITGASGFIGQQAIGPLVEKGYEVHLLGRSVDRFDFLDSRLRKSCAIATVDLCSQSSVAQCMARVKPTHLLHFAWYGDVRSRWESPANLDWVAATLWLARAFADQGGKRFVVSGSCAEYDWSHNTMVEGVTPYKPASLYGIAKAATRGLLHEGSGALGLSVAWGHIFFCYGPAEPRGRLLGDVITHFLLGDKVACTDGLQIRDYMHTKDIGRAFVALLDSSYEGAVNVASGQGLRVRDLVGEAARLLNCPNLVQFGALPRPDTDPPYLVADVRRLSTQIGFKPQYDLSRGLGDVIAWYRTRAGSP